MEFGFGQWEQTSANSLGVGFKSINISNTRISSKFSLTAGGKIGEKDLFYLGIYIY